MHGRVPATRHRQTICADRALPARVAHSNLVQAKPPVRADDLTARVDREIALNLRIAAAVDHTGHVHARCCQIPRGAVRVVIVAEDSHRFAGRHAVAVQIRPNRARCHDAGAIVVRKRDGPFKRACTQDRLLRHDAPEAFQRKRGAAGLVVADLFQRAVGALVIGTRHGRTRHQPDVVHLCQAVKHRRRPVRARLPVHLMRFRVQTPTHPAVFIRKDHVRACLSRRQRGHQTGRARANHQHIAEGKRPFIPIWVMIARQRAQTCRAADDRLVELFPKRLGPRKGFVVKASA